VGQAPEVQLRKRATAKADVFMLGCCLFYLFTGGRHPFDAPTGRPNS
jgi:DNA-binding helix-hairpin-helix protein with protein kinase domain